MALGTVCAVGTVLNFPTACMLCPSFACTMRPSSLFVSCELTVLATDLLVLGFGMGLVMEASVPCTVDVWSEAASMLGRSGRLPRSDNTDCLD